MKRKLEKEILLFKISNLPMHFKKKKNPRKIQRRIPIMNPALASHELDEKADAERKKTNKAAADPQTK